MNGLKIKLFLRQMTWKRLAFFLALIGLLLVFVFPALANQISLVPASPFTGPVDCKPFYINSRQCEYRPFDTSQDLAFQGNGSAQPAVALDNIAGFPTIHQPEFANDGYYGNGASWIGASSNSWLKIDLGQPVWIDRLQFGRDRLTDFDDRDPGQFTIAVALSDNVYANGDDSNDLNEYTQIFDSASLGFSGQIVLQQTVQASFDPVLARYVKLTVQQYGAAIDEVEIFGVAMVAVEIDIKPGSEPNCFNNDGHGVIPVAILSSADFDATQVDPLTVELDGQSVRVVGKKGNIQAHPEDVNGDGFIDLMVQIEDEDGTYSEGDTIATLTGETFDGTPIQGEDTLCIVP